jgi:uncharacterized protein YndB with AHSA1/START domain
MEEVLVTRIVEAPRELVFRAWTDPDELAVWYGPEHMQTPREHIHIDLRVGGRYELTMVGRDGGAAMKIGYEIVELVEPELIVLRSDPMPEVGMDDGALLRVEFHDHGAKTRVTLTDGPFPAAGCAHAQAGLRDVAELEAGFEDPRLEALEQLADRADALLEALRRPPVRDRLLALPWADADEAIRLLPRLEQLHPTRTLDVRERPVHELVPSSDELVLAAGLDGPGTTGVEAWHRENLTQQSP